ncbi:CocE/NonD family hydrolase [Streptomyces syringium]|uniref:CocE/NonD family hydrolase n=1 Tax=Streptomyces syringium TaxID=76729 RepID=UPI0037CE30CC
MTETSNTAPAGRGDGRRSIPVTPKPGQDPQTRLRTRRERLADQALARLLRLPPATSDYTVTRGIRVPMRDGVELLTDHYTPTSAPKGTLLVRDPYGRAAMSAVLFARFYAERGFHVVIQSCRGTFGSGGQFRPWACEAEDGADTVDWLRAQPWFEGRFATIGWSYLAFTQWALLSDPPPELVTAVMGVGPHDASQAAYGTGAFALGDTLAWSDMIARQEDLGQFRALLRATTAKGRLRTAQNTVPLAAAAESLLDKRVPSQREWIAHPNRTDPFWHPMRHDTALDKVEVPVLLIGGWQDLFLDQTLRQYERLRARGTDVALTIGPWTHGQTTPKGLGPITRETLDWLGQHLATPKARRRFPVRVFFTGGHGWTELPAWPPATTEHVLHTHPAGKLAHHRPADDARPSTFTYDPADPTPTLGGRTLWAGGGCRDNRSLEARPDVLTFTGPALTQDLYVAGEPVVELAHHSDNPHADFFVRLCEVDARGRSRNVSDAFVRLTPGMTQPTLRLQLDSIAHRFRTGSRIRLLVSGGCHPRYDRNLGTGEDPATSTRMKPSRRTIHHTVITLPALGSCPQGDSPVSRLRAGCRRQPRYPHRPAKCSPASANSCSNRSSTHLHSKPRQLCPAHTGGP